MQYKTALLSLFVALAAAKSIDEIVAEIPSCAKPCLDDASKSAGCDVDDHKCQCSSINQITNSAVLCLTKECSSDDLKTASKVSGELCLAVAAQSGGDKVSSAIGSVTSAVGSAFTSATGATSSAITSAIGGGLTIQTSTPTPSQTASPSPTGAANQAGAGLGMVGAAAMFALAL